MIFFIGLLVVYFGLSTPLYLSLNGSASYDIRVHDIRVHVASLVFIAVILLTPVACLLLLYVPKLPPAISLGRKGQNIFKTHCRRKGQNILTTQ